MTNRHTLLMIGLCLISSILTSCGLYDDAADTADTVDAAVTLLQDLDDLNVWETVSDRLVTLSDQTGYRATITLQSGAIDTSGKLIIPLETDISLDVQVDDNTNARITITESDQTRTYLVLGYDIDAEQTHIYRAEDDGYMCVSGAEDDGEDFNLIQGGIHKVFDIYGIEAIGMQTLAIVDRTDNEDATIVDRKAIEYDLVSKVEDALDIAAKFDNSDLRAALDEAGQFELSGDLYLDDETLALLRVTSFYTDLTTQHAYNLTFEITQWGAITDITPPSDTEIITACN